MVSQQRRRQHLHPPWLRVLLLAAVIHQIESSKVKMVNLDNHQIAERRREQQRSSTVSKRR